MKTAIIMKTALRIILFPLVFAVWLVTMLLLFTVWALGFFICLGVWAYNDDQVQFQDWIQFMPDRLHTFWVVWPFERSLDKRIRKYM